MSSSYGFLFIVIALFHCFTTIEAQDVSASTSDVATGSRSDEEAAPEYPFGPGNDDEALTDQICGTHPLKTIVKKIEHSQPDMDQQSVIRLLALMRLRAPKMWNSYQQMLAAYMNCKVMSAGGSLG